VPPIQQGGIVQHYVHRKTGNTYVVLGEVIDCDDDIHKFLYVRKGVRGMLVRMILRLLRVQLFTRSKTEFNSRFCHEKVSSQRRL
jgi:hypothetical protein